MEARFIPIKPRQADRARRGRGNSMYTPEKYRRYQEDFLKLLGGVNKVPLGDYCHLSVICFIPYPKSTPQKKRINGALKRSVPDTDNYTKAVKDILKKHGAVSDDAIIASNEAVKVWIDDPIGGVYFKLLTVEEFYAEFGNPMDLFKQ
jgi:Holliday junction resolvase RusA-like endonuclease